MKFGSLSQNTNSRRIDCASSTDGKSRGRENLSMLSTNPPDLRSKPDEPLPDLVSAGGADDDASVSSSDSSTLGVAHKP